MSESTSPAESTDSFEDTLNDFLDSALFPASEPEASDEDAPDGGVGHDQTRGS